MIINKIRIKIFRKTYIKKDNSTALENLANNKNLITLKNG